MSASLKQFEVGRPQIIAACLLLALLLQAVRAIYRAPLSGDEYQIVQVAVGSHPHSPESATPSEKRLQPADITDAILLYRIIGAVSAGWNWFELHAAEHLDPTQKARMARFPFALFGVWLGGALWWVARRLFGNSGGYIALLLFCFSPWVVALSSRVNADVIAAWGFFGVVYTAIGVAHTLYAPPRSWPPRVLLLGLAFGFAFSAHFLAGLAGVILALAFMMYLAVGRRRAAIAVLAISLAIAALFLWACYGFSPDTGSSLASGIAQLGWMRPRPFLSAATTASWSFLISASILLALETASIFTILLWRRARYFGNTAPWIVAAMLAAFAWLAGRTQAAPWMWALSFSFLFVGGMSADWLESQQRRPALIVLGALLSVYAASCIYL